ncbi:putative complexin-1 [Convolutriloba macropyga]|uniref:putative complexin-1 n=1 Tax=Convolutriloba macropyga TaxID=536237 RepID=UPI003F522787
MNFVVKQMVGDQMKNLTGGGGDETKEAAGGGEVDPEVEEERQRIEEERRLKHERFEAERQKMRQDIRDKYNIKKRDDPALAPPAPGRVGRGQFSPMPVKDEDDVELTMENLTAENVGKKANFLFKSAKTSVMGMFGGGE